MNMGRNGLVLVLSVAIAVGGSVFPAQSHLTLTQGTPLGIAAARGHLAPSGLAEASDMSRHPSPAYGTLPIAFEANQGQTAPQVNFLSRAGHRIVYLTPTEAVLVLSTAKDP